eukprot:881550-Pyramimonas_sp.AAC.1
MGSANPARPSQTWESQTFIESVLGPGPLPVHRAARRSLTTLLSGRRCSFGGVGASPRARRP